VPSLFRGVRISKLFGRDGIITFESNGVFVFARGRTVPRLFVPGLRDIRGFGAMYRDFLGAIREGRAPEMSLERAMDDQQLMDKVYQNVEHAGL
jgi:predicted dehydrogenase